MDLNCDRVALGDGAVDHEALARVSGVPGDECRGYAVAIRGRCAGGRVVDEAGRKDLVEGVWISGPKDRIGGRVEAAHHGDDGGIGRSPVNTPRFADRRREAEEAETGGQAEEASQHDGSSTGTDMGGRHREPLGVSGSAVGAGPLGRT